jgi:hypothetical protein
MVTSDRLVNYNWTDKAGGGSDDGGPGGSQAALGDLVVVQASDSFRI